MDSVIEKIQKLKKDGKKIVFTNGVFDIIHRGHVAYLNEAKALGDYLIVGLNADASVKRLKGNTRPVNKEEDRKFVMENLKAVDDVIIFTEDTPFNLISKIIPDILVKGGDWKEDQIVGSDIVKQNGGKVFSLKFIDNYSTTGIIEKIIKL
jgi:rfaE bifunctional protein nucleotidyltransferase chain/domain